MRKPNYSMERKDRERAKEAKAATKLEKRAAKRGAQEEAAAPPTRGDIDSPDVENSRSGG